MPDVAAADCTVHSRGLIRATQVTSEGPLEALPEGHHSATRGSPEHRHADVV